jgi:hypothetical protein
LKTLLKSYFILFFLVYICFLISCGKDIEKRHPSLLIYPDSRNIHYNVSRTIEQLSFTTEIRFPAQPFIEWLTRELQLQGWHPLKESFLNPGTPSSMTTGWESFIDGTTIPNQEVHQWIADWSNSSGDILTYGIQYRYPENGVVDLETLFVYGNYFPKKMAEKALKTIKRGR